MSFFKKQHWLLAVAVMASGLEAQPGALRLGGREVSTQEALGVGLLTGAVVVGGFSIWKHRRDLRNMRQAHEKELIRLKVERDKAQGELRAANDDAMLFRRQLEDAEENAQQLAQARDDAFERGRNERSAELQSVLEKADQFKAGVAEDAVGALTASRLDVFNLREELTQLRLRNEAELSNIVNERDSARGAHQATIAAFARERAKVPELEAEVARYRQLIEEKDALLKAMEKPPVKPILRRAPQEKRAVRFACPDGAAAASEGASETGPNFVLPEGQDVFRTRTDSPLREGFEIINLSDSSFEVDDDDLRDLNKARNLIRSLQEQLSALWERCTNLHKTNEEMLAAAEGILQDAASSAGGPSGPSKEESER